MAREVNPLLEPTYWVPSTQNRCTHGVLVRATFLLTCFSFDQSDIPNSKYLRLMASIHMPGMSNRWSWNWLSMCKFYTSPSPSPSSSLAIWEWQVALQAQVHNGRPNLSLAPQTQSVNQEIELKLDLRQTWIIWTLAKLGFELCF